MFGAFLCVFCALVGEVLCEMDPLILGSAVPPIASAAGPIPSMEIGTTNFTAYIKNPLTLKPLISRNHCSYRGVSLARRSTRFSNQQCTMQAADLQSEPSFEQMSKI